MNETTVAIDTKTFFQDAVSRILMLLLLIAR